MTAAEGWVPVRGGSMCPLLRPGDEVRVQWFMADEEAAPERGEIVVAREPGTGWIVHRVLVAAPSGGTLVLKGDSSLACEELGRDCLWGRVVGVRPGAENGLRPLGRSRLDELITHLSARAAGARWPLRGLWLRAAMAAGWWRRRAL